MRMRMRMMRTLIPKRSGYSSGMAECRHYSYTTFGLLIQVVIPTRWDQIYGLRVTFFIRNNGKASCVEVYKEER